MRSNAWQTTTRALQKKKYYRKITKWRHADLFLGGAGGGGDIGYTYFHRTRAMHPIDWPSKGLTRNTTDDLTRTCGRGWGWHRVHTSYGREFTWRAQSDRPTRRRFIVPVSTVGRDAGNKTRVSFLRGQAGRGAGEAKEVPPLFMRPNGPASRDARTHAHAHHTFYTSSPAAQWILSRGYIICVQPLVWKTLYASVLYTARYYNTVTIINVSY